MIIVVDLNTSNQKPSSDPDPGFISEKLKDYLCKIKIFLWKTPVYFIFSSMKDI